MLEERLLSTYRDLVLVYMWYAFIEVLDIAMIVERNYLTAQTESECWAYCLNPVHLLIADLKGKGQGMGILRAGGGGFEIYELDALRM